MRALPVVVASLVLGLGAGCSTGPGRPDVDVPARAEAPVSGGVVERGWLRETAARTQVPARVLAAYARAADRVGDDGCELGWNTLAGIGRVETAHGRFGGAEVDADGVARPSILGPRLDGSAGVLAIRDTDGGALDGDTTWDRAVGPMQFIPATWARLGVDADGDGRADPHSIDDATLTAARYLCDAGDGLAGDDGWIDAVLTYNRSAAYARKVAAAAAEYAP